MASAFDGFLGGTGGEPAKPKSAFDGFIEGGSAFGEYIDGKKKEPEAKPFTAQLLPGEGPTTQTLIEPGAPSTFTPEQIGAINDPTRESVPKSKNPLININNIVKDVTERVVAALNPPPGPNTITSEYTPKPAPRNIAEPFNPPVIKQGKIRQPKPADAAPAPSRAEPALYPSGTERGGQFDVEGRGTFTSPGVRGPSPSAKPPTPVENLNEDQAAPARGGILGRTARDIGAGAYTGLAGMSRATERYLKWVERGGQEWGKAIKRVIPEEPEVHSIDDDSLGNIIGSAIKNAPRMAVEGLAEAYGIAGEGAKAVAEGSEFISGKLQVQDPNLYDKVMMGVGTQLPSFLPGVGMASAAKSLGVAAKIGTAIAGRATTQFSSNTAAALYAAKRAKDVAKYAKIAGSSAGAMTSAAFESSIDAGVAWSEAKQMGKTDAEADAIATRIFMKELPMTAVSEKLGIFSDADTLVGKAASGILSNAPQEMGAQAIQNVELGKRAGEGVVEAGVIGGIIGGGFGALEAGTRKLAKQQQELYGVGGNREIPAKPMNDILAAGAKPTPAIDINKDKATSDNVVLEENNIKPVAQDAKPAPAPAPAQPQVEPIAVPAPEERQTVKVEPTGEVQVRDERAPVTFKPEPAKPPVDPEAQQRTETAVAGLLDRVDTMPEEQGQSLIRDLSMGRAEFVRAMEAARQGKNTDLSPVMADMAKAAGVDFGYVWDSVNKSQPTRAPEGQALKTAPGGPSMAAFAAAIQTLKGNRYDESRIGTAGGLVHGWGVYSTESDSVMDVYIKKYKAMIRSARSIEARLREKKPVSRDEMAYYNEDLKFLPKDIDENAPVRYSLSLRGTQDNYLFWDGTMEQQSDEVANRLMRSEFWDWAEAYSDVTGVYLDPVDSTGMMAYRFLEKLAASKLAPKELREMGRAGKKFIPAKAASKYLESIGIPGHFYMGEELMDTEGTAQRNFVNYNATDVQVEGKAGGDVYYKTAPEMPSPFDYYLSGERTEVGKPAEPQPKTVLDEGDFDWAKQGDVMRSVKLFHLVDLVKEITGKFPHVLEVINKKSMAVGRAFTKTGKIQLIAGLGGNARLASVVLAHEIGHIIHAMGEKGPTMARGGLLGAMSSFYRYTRQALSETIKSRDSIGAEMDSIRNGLRAQINEEAKARRDAKQGFEGMTRMDWQKAEYNRRIDGELNKNGYYTEAQIVKDLTPVVKWWNRKYGLGYNPTAAEVYADAFSILLNDPETLFKKAPLFSQIFKNWADSRPDFVNAYRKMSYEISKGDDYGYANLVGKILDDYYLEEKLQSEKSLFEKTQDLYRKATSLNWSLVYRLYPWQKIRSKLGLPIDATAIPEIELLRSASSVEAVFLHEVARTVDDNLSKNNIPREMFGLKLFVERIINGDRSEIFNSRGVTPEVAQKINDNHIKAQLGGQRYAALEKIYSDFQNEIWQKMLIDKHLVGIYNEKTIAALKANTHYATFSPIFNLMEKEWGGEGSEFSKGLYHQVGTLQPIGNPYTATIETAMKLIYISVRSRAVQSAVKMLEQYDPGSIRRAQFMGKGQFDRAPKGYTTLHYLDNGVARAVHVREQLGMAFESNSYGTMSGVVNSIAWLEKYSGLGLAKMLFVNLNPGFWPWNVLRDSFYTYTNLPEYKAGIGFFQSLANTVGSISAAWKYLRGTEPDVIMAKLLEEGVIHSAFEKDIRPEAVGVDRFFLRHKIATQGEHFENNVERAKYYLEWYQDLGRSTDIASKRAAWMFLKEQHPDWSDRKLAYIVKNMTGTPNTAGSGPLAPIYNFAFLYSHIAMMGFRGSYESYKRAPWAFASKVMVNSVIPRLLYRAALMGWLDNDFFKKLGISPTDAGDANSLQRFFKNIPESDLASYIIIPVYPFFDADGKSIYARIPQDELSRLSGGVTFLSLTSLAEGDKGAVMGLLEAFFNSSTYVGGQLPSMAPPAQVLKAAVQLSAGGTPVNAVGQDIIPRAHIEQGLLSKESLKSFGAYTASTFGFGMFYKFKADRSPKRVESGLEDVVQTPVVGPALSRFVKVSNSGLYTEAYRQKKRAEQAQAKEEHATRDLMMDWWDKQVEDNGEVPSTSSIKAYIKEFAKTPEAKGKSFAQLRKAFYNSILSGLNEPGYSLIKTGSIEDKVQALVYISQVKSPDDFEKFMEEGRARKLISSNLRHAYQKALREPPTE